MVRQTQTIAQVKACRLQLLLLLLPGTVLTCSGYTETAVPPNQDRLCRNTISCVKLLSDDSRNSDVFVAGTEWREECISTAQDNTSTGFAGAPGG